MHSGHLTEGSLFYLAARRPPPTHTHTPVKRTPPHLSKIRIEMYDWVWFILNDFKPSGNFDYNHHLCNLLAYTYRYRYFLKKIYFLTLTLMPIGWLVIMIKPLYTQDENIKALPSLPKSKFKFFQFGWPYRICRIMLGIQSNPFLTFTSICSGYQQNNQY